MVDLFLFYRVSDSICPLFFKAEATRRPSTLVLNPFKFFSRCENFVAPWRTHSCVALMRAASTLVSTLGRGHAALYYTIANSSQPATILAGPESVGRKKIAQRVSAGKA